MSLLFSYGYPYFPYPFLPNDCDLPPTLYALLNSMVNYDNKNPVKIKDLASASHSQVFDFNYPLDSSVDKDFFETQILKRFLMRRIGYDTFTAFQIALDSKLNEIMPKYNKMFSAISNWNIFSDGEKITHTSTDNRTINTNQENSNTLNNSSTTESIENMEHLFSDTPQNQLENVKNGEYLTEASYDNRKGNGKDSSISEGSSNTNTNTKDNNIVNETTERTPADKIALYTEFQAEVSNIFTLIYKDLDSLFYQLV